MDDLEYFAIVEQLNDYLNPTSDAKLEELIDYCGLEAGQRLLDVGCGKGWLLRRIAERFEVNGEGGDRHPAFIAEARRLAEPRS